MESASLVPVQQVESLKEFLSCRMPEALEMLRQMVGINSYTGNRAGVPILGTAVKSIDAAGDREQFRELLQQLNLKQPANGIARNPGEARAIARQIGYPVLVRPSFVLGGRAMQIVYDETSQLRLLDLEFLRRN